MSSPENAMPDGGTEDKGLSSKLQSMKFMKRSAEQAKLEAENKLERKIISDSHWRATYSSSDVPEERLKTRVVYESSYLKMPQTDSSSVNRGIGRRSFRSFNKKTDQVNEEVEKTIRAEQMSEEEKRTEEEDRKMAEALAKTKASRARAVPTSLREQNQQHKRRRPSGKK
ncbi:hypothetical protein LPJ64_003356 [Coemansia asiatica]|uniref:M-phase phosphoprotein 6 n=1 Tax=Coemansia asiatica TaxID=1052880 RepID=A0A9W8CI98_9FUNG|nr:hypothetical protein LPJ64_003356 [Coemansia asiatica]